MRVVEVTDGAALEALRGEWSALWSRCPEATPFQAPEWLLPWWRHLGRGRLRTLCLRRAGRLVGLAPLAEEPYLGTPLRRILLLGTGVSDYLDVLIEPGHEREGAAAILDQVLRDRAAWALCDFQQLRPGSALLGAPLPASCAPLDIRQEVCPVLSLPESAAGLREALPSRLHSNLRYYRRRMDRLGPVSVDTAGPDTLARYLEALFRLHGARWRRRGLPGAFARGRVRAFHREAAAGMLARGWLRLYALRLRGTVGAALYCFVAGGRGYYYSGGFLPELAALSPGTLLIGHAVEDAVRAGAREFDFLRGDEPYKYAWGAADRENRRRLLWGDGLPGRLARRLNDWERRVDAAARAAARRLAGGRICSAAASPRHGSRTGRAAGGR